MLKDKGYIHIYTGNGKGKTSAAIGIAVRASGVGLKTYFAQLMKSYLYSELIALKKIPEIKTVQFGDDNFVLEKRPPSEKERKSASDALLRIENIMSKGDYDIVVIDEVFVAIYFGLITNNDLLRIIKKKPDNLELILTGRYADEAIIKKADIVSRIEEVKHYYSQGILSRKGIDS